MAVIVEHEFLPRSIDPAQADRMPSPEDESPVVGYDNAMGFHRTAQRQLAAGDVDGAIATLQKGAELFTYNSPFYRQLAKIRRAFSPHDRDIAALPYDPQPDEHAWRMTATSVPAISKARRKPSVVAGAFRRGAPRILAANVTELELRIRRPASYISEAARIRFHGDNDEDWKRGGNIHSAIKILTDGINRYPTDLSLPLELASLERYEKRYHTALSVLTDADGEKFLPRTTHVMALIRFDLMQPPNYKPWPIMRELGHCARLFIDYGSLQRAMTDENRVAHRGIERLVLRLIDEAEKLSSRPDEWKPDTPYERDGFVKFHSTAAQMATMYGHHAEALALLDRSEKFLTAAKSGEPPRPEVIDRMLTRARAHFALNLKYRGEFYEAPISDLSLMDRANHHLREACQYFESAHKLAPHRSPVIPRISTAGKLTEPPPAGTLVNEGASAGTARLPSNVVALTQKIPSPENYMEQATRFFNVGQPTAATDILNRANAEFPYDAPVALSLVKIYAHHAHFRRAEKILLNCQNDEVIPAVSNALAQLHLEHADACTSPRAIARQYAACADALIAHHINQSSTSLQESDPAWATAQRIADDLIKRTGRLHLPPRHGRSQRERAMRLNTADLLYRVAEVAHCFGQPDAALILLKRSERIALPNAKAIITWAEAHHELSRQMNSRHDRQGASHRFKEARQACALAVDFGMGGERVEERVSLLKLSLERQSEFFSALHTAPR